MTHFSCVFVFYTVDITPPSCSRTCSCSVSNILGSLMFLLVFLAFHVALMVCWQMLEMVFKKYYIGSFSLSFECGLDDTN